MQRPRHQLLAAAAGARDQDGAPAAGHLLDQREQPAHHGALADDVVHPVGGLQLPAQIHVLPAEVAALQRLGHHQVHLLHPERLHDVVHRPHLHGLDGRLDRRVPGDHDDRHLRSQGGDLLEQLHSVHARQHQVEDHQIERLLAHEGRGLLARFGGEDPESGLLKRLAEDLSHPFVIVHDQDLFLHAPLLCRHSGR